MKSELEIYTELMAKPKPKEPVQHGFHCEFCMTPVEFYTGNSLKNYPGKESCELYSDWMDLAHTDEKHTRDELLTIVISALKHKYLNVRDWDALVDELLFIDIDDLGVLARKDGLIYLA